MHTKTFGQCCKSIAAVRLMTGKNNEEEIRFGWQSEVFWITDMFRFYCILSVNVTIAKYFKKENGILGD